MTSSDPNYTGGPVAAPDGPLGPLYAGKLVETNGGVWYFMAFRGDGDRSFTGELTDPLPVRYHHDGHIVAIVRGSDDA
jgi:hypothetical protein